MTNVYSAQGILTVILLFICSSVYFYYTPVLRRLFLSEKSGCWGVFYKASVIGRRLHMTVSTCCFALALYLLLW